MQKTFPVSEIFGPTIQGEGKYIGMPSIFIRFHGCDFKCEWCDTAYALSGPAPHTLNVTQIVSEVRRLSNNARWRHHNRRVVFTGGNPALFDLDPLVSALNADGFEIAVETQGSKWKDWMYHCFVTVSPKTPSSGIIRSLHSDAYQQFFDNYRGSGGEWKFVVANRDDLEYVRSFLTYYDAIDFEDVTLQLCSDQVEGEFDVVRYCNEFKRMTEVILQYPELNSCRILPQLHKLLWGNQTGV